MGVDIEARLRAGAMLNDVEAQLSRADAMPVIARASRLRDSYGSQAAFVHDIRDAAAAESAAGCLPISHD